MREDACRVSVRAQHNERQGEGVEPYYTRTDTEIYQTLTRFLLAMCRHRITVTARSRELLITLFCLATTFLSLLTLYALLRTQPLLRSWVASFIVTRSAPYSVFKADANPSLIPSYILAITTPLYSPPTYPSNARSCPFGEFTSLSPGQQVRQWTMRAKRAKRI